MLLVSAVVTLARPGLLDRPGHDRRRHDTPLTIYHPTFLVLAAGVSNAFLAGDLFNLFVSFEMLLFASYVLLTLGGTGPGSGPARSTSSSTCVSSSLFLISLAAVYAATGSLNLAQLAERLDDLPDPGQPGAAAAAAHHLLDQGGGLPAVVLAAGQLPHRARAGHRRVRRPAHQGRRLRDHPHPDAAVPRQPAHRPAPVGGAAHPARRHPRRGRPDRHQANAVLHPGQPHRVHDLRHRLGTASATPGRSSTSSTTSPSRPRCSWCSGSSNAGAAAPPDQARRAGAARTPARRCCSSCRR